MLQHDPRLQQFQGMPVMVTGGTGFIGRNLVSRLRALGARVTCMVRPSSIIPDSWKCDDEGPPPHLATGDLTDVQAVSDAVSLARPRRVFHLAALIERSTDFSRLPRYLTINTVGTSILLAACSALGSEVDAIVSLGTGQEYGPSDSIPLREDLPPRPVTPYGISKAAATAVCCAAWRAKKLPVTVLRGFLFYGPGHSPNFFLSQLLKAAVTGAVLDMTAGAQIRDFVHVRDAVEALLLASATPALRGEVANVCSGTEVALKDVVSLVSRLTGRDDLVRLGTLPYRQGEIFRYFGSPEKLRAATGWTPQVSLEDGLGYFVKAGVWS